MALKDTSTSFSPDLANAWSLALVHVGVVDNLLVDADIGDNRLVDVGVGDNRLVDVGVGSFDRGRNKDSGNRNLVICTIVQ
jgi:hypothetical protein